MDEEGDKAERLEDEARNVARRPWGSDSQDPERWTGTPARADRETRDHAQGRSARPISWIMATVIIIGFVLGGIGLILGGARVLAWVGGGIVLVGGIVAWATGIMEDYDTRQHRPDSWI